MLHDVPILMYHHVVPAVEVGPLAPFAVSRSLFSRQMEWLVQAGFRTITLEQLFNYCDGKSRTEPNGKPVVITFDDCPASLLDHAVPELSKRGMTTTFFAVAGKPGGHNDWDANQGAPHIPLMTAGDLRSLAERSFEIGSHGLNHSNLRRCSPEQIRRELEDSRLILEDEVGRPVRFLAYPYGEYPHGYAGYCQEAGYRGAVSIFSRARTVTEDPYCLRRVLVHEGDQMLRFRFKLSKWYQLLRVYVDRRVLRGTA
jgi:peptidoglycan/xylan/chitin deacetylase (PgdA/CDA1 family)